MLILHRDRVQKVRLHELSLHFINARDLSQLVAPETILGLCRPRMCLGHIRVRVYLLMVTRPTTSPHMVQLAIRQSKCLKYKPPLFPVTRQARHY